jgi:3-hydroxyisobutyrate dehydrogenase-like beta-hydroxyacid dehydrogenase
MSSFDVGFIGLGKMGHPMARNLLKAGFSLTVYDRDEKPVRELAQLGARAARLPKEVAERSEVVWIMVPHQAVEEVVLGEQGVLQGMKEGGIVIDGGNSHPASSRRLAKIASEKGVFFLDVGCSGGPSAAEQGTLALMVGGNKKAFGRCRPIFEVLGSVVKHFGPSGNGHLVKVINNVLVATSSLAVSEALALAIRAGLDPKEVAEVMNAGVARGWLLELAQRIFERQEGIQGIVGKVGGGETLCWGLELAHELDLPLPLASTTYELRKLSRREQNEIFAINAALRREFGGHEVEKMELEE